MRLFSLHQFWKSLSTIESVKPLQEIKNPQEERQPSSANAFAPEIKQEQPELNRGRYTCRLGSEDDLEGIAQLFRSHNYGPQKAEWLRWKYLQNPDGPAKMFIGIDSDGSVAAIRVHLPRSFTSMSTGTFVANQSVDWFVAEKNRGTGVYAQLRELSRRTRKYPTIGFPNELSKRITRTFEGDKRTYFPIDEWWFPVATGGSIRRKPYRLAAPCIDALSTAYCSFWLGKSPAHLRMERISRFNRDYQLDPNYIHGVRSADFLNWRFIDNPMRKFTTFEFLKGSESIGYCVLDVCGSFAKMYDLVLNQHPRECLRLLIDYCREREISHLVFKSVGFGMKRYGFLRIGTPGYLDTLNTPQGKWLITLADKD